MSEKTLRDLEERIDSIRKEQQGLIAQHSSLENKIRARSERIASYEAVIRDMREEFEREEREAIPTKLMRNEIVEIFREEGRPLPNAEIYRRLLERGVPVNGQDPVKNVGSHLSLDERFERYGLGVWGLKSWKGSPPKGGKESKSEEGKPPPDIRSFMQPESFLSSHDAYRKVVDDYLTLRKNRGA